MKAVNKILDDVRGDNYNVSYNYYRYTRQSWESISVAGHSGRT